MNSALQLLGALGGGVAFLGALGAIVRGIFRQTNATEGNTKALQHVTDELSKLNGRLGNHETRISHLEGRQP